MNEINKFPELMDIDLDTAVKNLQKAVNYGDYLAEQKKSVAESIYDKKVLYRKQRRVALSNKDICSGKDAKARAEQADEYASDELINFEKGEIEGNYLADLFKNNHDRIEALRTIISSKKQNLDNYNRTQM